MYFPITFLTKRLVSCLLPRKNTLPEKDKPQFTLIPKINDETREVHHHTLYDPREDTKTHMLYNTANTKRLENVLIINQGKARIKKEEEKFSQSPLQTSYKPRTDS
jgi:hypothetical protein